MNLLLLSFLQLLNCAHYNVTSGACAPIPVPQPQPNRTLLDEVFADGNLTVLAAILSLPENKEFADLLGMQQQPGVNSTTMSQPMTTIFVTSTFTVSVEASTSISAPIPEPTGTDTSIAMPTGAVGGALGRGRRPRNPRRPQRSGFVGEMSDYTLFAPTDEAFRAMNISAWSIRQNQTQFDLGYLIAPGMHPMANSSDFCPLNATNGANGTNVTEAEYAVDTLLSQQSLVINAQQMQVYSGFLNASMVVEANRTASNGIIHVLQAVPIVPGALNATLQLANQTQFCSLLGAQSGNLTNVTVFVPSQLPPNASIDAYIVDGLIYASNFTVGSVQARDGGLIQLGGSVGCGNLTVNASQVAQPDVLFDGGVMHLYQVPQQSIRI